jgi:ribosomal protein L11 methyltransferase
MDCQEENRYVKRRIMVPYENLYIYEVSGEVTGSGILALAATKWGAEEILVVDSNELAVEPARRNVLLNNESGRIEVRQTRAEEVIGEKGDLVCANLHFQILETLMEKKAFFRKRWLILFGFFIKDAECFERRFACHEIEIFQKLEEKGWMTLVGWNRSVLF